MTMTEAIIAAQELGGSYIAKFSDGWQVLGRTPSRKVRGLVYVAFDGSTFRV